MKLIANIVSRLVSRVSKFGKSKKFGVHIMPAFQLGPYREEIVTVKRSQVFFQCQYRLPDEVKDKMAVEESFPLEADLVMGFYCDPMPGDVIEWRGHQWGIKYRKHYPNALCKSTSLRKRESVMITLKLTITTGKMGCKIFTY